MATTMARSGDCGRMGGGGKTATAPPVSLYRKQIGRQDSRKAKGHLRDVKASHDAKEMAPKAARDSVSRMSSYPE